MSYHAPARRPVRRKKDSTPLLIALLALAGIPALGFAVYKFVIDRPPPTEEIAVYAPPTRSSSSQPALPPLPKPKYDEGDWAANLPDKLDPAGGAPVGNIQNRFAPGNMQGGGLAMADQMGVMNVGVAVAKACKKIKESVDLNKTLVVWLIDASPSCEPRRGEVAQQIAALYPSLAPAEDKTAKPEDAKLLSTVCSYAADVQFVTAEPTADADALRSAVADVKTEPGNVENTFRAIETVVNKYASYAAPPHARYLSVVVVTDEVGNDQQERDRVAELLRKSSVPVYVVGQAASFGSIGPQAASAEGPGGVQIGPESRDVETIHLDFPGGMSMMGGGEQCSIGPYSLSYLCRESGGEYFAVGSMGATASLPPQYYPKYQSEKDYQAYAGSNKALQALFAASKLPAAKQIGGPQMAFEVDENGLAPTRDVDMAQRPVALIMPQLNDLFDTLKKGEGDRAKLVEPRHQAAFDTALGRAMAAKVRTEGYIVLLAAFKAGRKLPSGQAGVWTLQPAEGIEKNSVLDGMAKKSREYLEGVVKNHPGTPWAQAAQQELSMPIGWAWQGS